MPDDPLAALAEYQRLLDSAPPPIREIAASDGATLDALIAGIPQAEPGPFSGLLGSLGAVPIVIDETLPPGRVEIRDRDGSATTRLRLIAGRWFDEDKLREAAERASRTSLTGFYRAGPRASILAGPLFDGHLPPTGV